MSTSKTVNKTTQSTTQIMLWVIFATLPGIIALFSFFGWGIWFNLIICSFVAVITEAWVLKLRKRPIQTTLLDCSALVTGILLAIALPPLTPWWIAAVGTFFAILFAKQLYGGLGFNIFNPAMVGYVLLLISFPVSMTAWLPPQSMALNHAGFIDSLLLVVTQVDSQGNSLSFYQQGIDGFTLATPLDTLRTGYSQGIMSSEMLSQQSFSGDLQNSWWWINLAFLTGGLLLFLKKSITWHIPISLLLGLLTTATVSEWIMQDQITPASVHLFSGATMFAAFFIATDPVSAATTPKGRLVFGFGIGFITVMIRNFGAYPDAFAFAVLLMNMLVPLIDHYTQPLVYGHSKGNVS